MNVSHRVPGAIVCTSDLRSSPWPLRSGQYHEGEVIKVGHFRDGEQGPVVAQWCRLTDGTDAVIYTPWGQAVEVVRTMQAFSEDGPEAKRFPRGVLTLLILGVGANVGIWVLDLLLMLGRY